MIKCDCKGRTGLLLSLEAATAESRSISSRDVKLQVIGYDVRIMDDEGFMAYFESARPEEIRLYEV